MVRQASFFAAFLPEGTTVSEDGEVGTFYFPAADDSSSPVLTAGNAASAFRNAPEVWAVMEYLASAEYAEERQKAQRELKGGDASGFLTANLEVDLSLWSDLEAGFIEILASGRSGALRRLRLHASSCGFRIVLDRGHQRRER